MILCSDCLELRAKVDEILPEVSKPARYIGGELGSVSKPLDITKVRFALAFPDVYEVGMSNLGLRILYKALNDREGIWAERTFSPARDMEELMRSHDIPLFSLESTTALSSFDAIGFSLAYEMCFTTVLNMLDLAGIPLRRIDRGEDSPIIIAGGHCATNPEPMSEFIDAFVIGDGEEAIVEVAEVLERYKGDRAKCLSVISKLDGLYVPAIKAQGPIVARVVSDLDAAAFPETLIMPHIQAVHDRVVVEVMRGCTRGCRFCQAGMITRPVRERSLSKIIEQTTKSLASSGYDEVALTSLSSADYSCIQEAVTQIIDRFEGDRVGVSLPSLRADASCVELAAQIQRVRKSGLTFAPEAGSQRLRDVINKNVSEEQLLAAVEAAIEHGWRRIKLYFMIGLPTETQEDLEGIGALVSRVIDIGRRLRAPLTLNVTISPFVPKPHTPFQWRAMDDPEVLQEKIAFIRPLLKGKNISLSWHEPGCSRIEAALARGDKAVGEAIYNAWVMGARLEQDNFVYTNWRIAFEQAGLDIGRYANTVLDKDAPLPWDHIVAGPSKKFLAREDAKADLGEVTGDCREGECSGCGVKENVGCSVCPPPRPVSEALIPMKEAAEPSDADILVVFTFEKSAQARYLGHLDIIRLIDRAIRIAKVDVVYSQGFNPRPKMSIASALPLGATAGGELLSVRVHNADDLAGMVKRINAALPGGIMITQARLGETALKTPVVTASDYIIEVSYDPSEDRSSISAAIANLMAEKEKLLIRASVGKRREVDIRPGIELLEIIDAHHLRAVLVHLAFTVKPSEVVEALGQSVQDLRLVSMHRSALITNIESRQERG